jgi:hypothetical protein
VSKVGFRFGVAWRGEKGADYATEPGSGHTGALL